MRSIFPRPYMSAKILLMVFTATGIACTAVKLYNTVRFRPSLDIMKEKAVSKTHSQKENVRLGELKMTKTICCNDWEYRYLV